jgi:bacterioferritin-associated ferredoxin
MILISLYRKIAMYVCICKAVSDREIRRAADNGARELRDLREQLGVATGCGQCAREARRLLRACRDDAADGGRLTPDLVPAPA